MNEALHRHGQEYYDRIAECQRSIERYFFMASQFCQIPPDELKKIMDEAYEHEEEIIDEWQSRETEPGASLRMTIHYLLICSYMLDTMMRVHKNICLQDGIDLREPTNLKALTITDYGSSSSEVEANDLPIANGTPHGADCSQP